MNNSSRYSGKIFLFSIITFLLIVFFIVSLGGSVESSLQKNQLPTYWRVIELSLFISGASGILSGMYCLFKKIKLI
jgi:hypothetical protein